jgi:hypothetical protein
MNRRQFFAAAVAPFLLRLVPRSAAPASVQARINWVSAESLRILANEIDLDLMKWRFGKAAKIKTCFDPARLPA